MAGLTALQEKRQAALVEILSNPDITGFRHERILGNGAAQKTSIIIMAHELKDIRNHGIEPLQTVLGKIISLRLAHIVVQPLNNYFFDLELEREQGGGDEELKLMLSSLAEVIDNPNLLGML